MKRAIIYARVNSNDETENDYHLLCQEEKLGNTVMISILA